MNNEFVYLWAAMASPASRPAKPQQLSNGQSEFSPTKHSSRRPCRRSASSRARLSLGVGRVNVVSDFLLIVAVVVSAAWCIAAPSYEPLLASLGATTVLLTRAVAVFQGQAASGLLCRLLWPIARWRDRRTPRAELEFDSLMGTRAIHHSVKVWSVWDGEGPTTWMELKHRQDTGSWTTPYRFEGHSTELEARDVDGDGSPELVVRYACGGHTRVMNILRVDLEGFLVPIPGAEVGSDLPELVLEDRDADGKVEIYAWQRDWARVPVRDSVLEVYAYRDGEFRKIDERPNDVL